MAKGRRAAKGYPGPAGSLAVLCAAICAIALAAGSCVRVRNGGSAYDELLSLQLPFIYARELSPRMETPPTPTPVPVRLEMVDVDDGVGEEFIVELVGIEQSGEKVDLSGGEPKILIYHTHYSEAYTETPGYEYEESGSWRTMDETRNIVAVGERLSQTLRDKWGIASIHDRTDHEPPKLSTAYSRSVLTMENQLEENPSLAMFIDVHRDAYGSSPSGREDFVVIDGREVARLMFVVGTGEGATGAGFGEMPDFAANYALAKKLTDYLASIDPGLVRNIRIKTGRYNQHISNQCLLVEVGHNANTLEQALNAADILAEAIAVCAGAEADGDKAVLPLAP